MRTNDLHISQLWVLAFVRFSLPRRRYTISLHPRTSTFSLLCQMYRRDSTLQYLQISHLEEKLANLRLQSQCPFPDASNPLPLLLLCDFVFVQFYNNPSCEIGSSAFVNSILTWSAALQNSKLATKTRLYIGTPGWSAAGPTAYASLGGAQGIAGVVQTAAHLGLQNLGGAMFWDGPEGRANIMNGQSIVSWAKQGLSS